MIHVAVQEHVIDVAAELGVHDAGGYGASASFIGRVRGDDGLIELFLDHHPVLTVTGLEELAAQAAGRWNLAALTLVHRVGAMAPGDTIVLVLASSPHRSEALAACEFLIDRLKIDVMLWKRETFADGRAQWVEQRGGDHERAGRWDRPLPTKEGQRE
jgi:molybdopterin synthase catalytic subunit